ncbi:MAG: insulinase family protein [Patescibacteria group bacterium]|nr:insulinase family protein [Patescibacteria group bacterium]MDW8279802.1 pitrilysin family protein [bacterium]
MSSYKKVIFSNGLRLILVPQSNSLATTILILVEAGSEYETKEINGISHFLEHMCFKGTKNRPNPGIIAEELDSLGAEYNAFTSQEYTGYWAKVQNNKINEAIDIVSDLYLNPIFDEKEIEKEKGVIIEEINMYEDIPMRRVQDLFMQLLYGDQPAGWDIAGQKEIIQKLQKKDFIDYRFKHYISSKTVIVVAGNFNQKLVTKKIEKIFGNLPKKKKILKPKTIWEQNKPQTLIKFKESDQDHLVLGVRTFDIFDKRKYILQVLSNILGGGMSSRLFKKIREELGAAYYVRAGIDLFIDHGFLAVSVGSHHDKTKIVIKTILDEFKKLTKELVSQDELEKAKNHLIGNFILGLETSDELAFFYGGEELLTKKIYKPEEIIKNIKKVQPEDIRNIARLIFKDSILNLAIIGPYKEDIFKNILSLKA